MINKTTVLTCLVAIVGITESKISWANSISCTQVKQMLVGHVLRYNDMNDDDVEVVGSVTVNVETYALKFTSVAKDQVAVQKAIFEKSQETTKNMMASVFRPNSNSRCRLSLNGQVRMSPDEKYNDFSEFFEVIALSSTTIWLGNLNEEQGEIFFTLEQIPEKELSEVNYSDNQINELKNKSAVLESRYQELTGTQEMTPDYYKYEGEYYQAISKGVTHFRQANLPDFSKELHSSQVILFADYHSVPTFVQTATSMFKQLTKGPRPVTLVLEWIDKSFKEDVDAYFAGEITLLKVLEKVQASGTWSYSLRNYGQLLAVAKAAHARVLQFEDSETWKMTANQRDHVVTKGIHEDAIAHPDDVYLVVYGAYHVLGQGHMQDQLINLGMRNPLVITGFADDVFWAGLSRQHNMKSLQFLSFGPGAYYFHIEAPWDRIGKLVKSEEGMYELPQGIANVLTY